MWHMYRGMVSVHDRVFIASIYYYSYAIVMGIFYMTTEQTEL